MSWRQERKRTRIHDPQILHADNSSLGIHHGVCIVGRAHGASGSCVVDGGHGLADYV